MTVSLWQDTAAWPGEIAHRLRSADVCVVGAGIVGATLATLLGEAGKSVIVLEAGTIAGGASGRNAGHCIAGMRDSYHRAVERLGVPKPAICAACSSTIATWSSAGATGSACRTNAMAHSTSASTRPKLPGFARQPSPSRQTAATSNTASTIPLTAASSVASSSPETSVCSPTCWYRA